jgi:quercetin dioxygenase-like cupin family protein
MIVKHTAGTILAVASLAGITGCTSANQPGSIAVATADPTIAPTPTQPPTDILTPLLTQALPDVPGKTFTSAIVDFAPGARAVPHRHGDAFAYAYVLEGTVRSQLNDMPAVTYGQGENWIEQPGDHHVLAENTSQTEPAKLMVVFIADAGAELKVDDHHS